MRRDDVASASIRRHFGTTARWVYLSIKKTAYNVDSRHDNMPTPIKSIIFFSMMCICLEAPQFSYFKLFQTFLIHTTCTLKNEEKNVVYTSCNVKEHHGVDSISSNVD